MQPPRSGQNIGAEMKDKLVVIYEKNGIHDLLPVNHPMTNA